MGSPNKFNDEMKNKLIELRGEGLGSKRIAKELGIPLSTIKKWINKAGLGGSLEQYKELDRKNHLISCLNCGKEVNTKHETTKFCEKKCRNEYFRKHQKEKEKVCERCGNIFKTIKSKYCSDDCRRKPDELKKQYEHKDKINKNCISCNKVFETTREHKKYCSYDCSYQYYLDKKAEQRKNEAVYYQKRCKECGKHYSTTRKKAKYCSLKCGERYSNRKTEVVRRKRIRENGKVDWNISIGRLLKRDGHICYLCGESVNTNVDTNSDDYPSIEHVIPISKGGTHTWDNVKIAHRKCNSLKQDKIIKVK